MARGGGVGEDWRMASLQKRLGKTIKDLREEKKLSQEALAEITGLHRTYISMVERNKNTLTVTTLEKVAKAFGLEASQLLAAAEKAKD